MQSIVEVVCVGSGSNNSKTYNSVYNDPGYCKMVIVQDDDKFPSPRLCLLRRWPNFEGGFGFNLYEDLISQTGSLKVEEVVYNSPAEAGGLRKNDVIVEINGENIEFKSFFRLVEILKDACNQSEMELLVLAEPDAEWYRVRNICVNNNFPNIEYCETPYYGHILKPLESFVPSAESGGNTKTHSSTLSKSGNSQIEFHSSTGKLYRTTLVIDKEKDSVYRRIEELPSSVAPSQSADQITVPPLRPDGTYRHPSSEPSVRVYYRRDRECLNTQIENAKSDEINNATADSGHGSIRRSTPLSTATNTAANMNGMSPYSTLGKSYGEQAAVDLLHDKWADLMDKYLDNRFRSSSAQGHVASEEHHEHLNHRDASTGITLGRRNKYTIPLSDANPSMSSKKSRCQSPNDGSFSYLYSGRDDFQSASATSFREINRQSTSPYHHLAQQYQRGPQRYPSPHHSVASPTRHQQRPQSQNRYSNIIPDVVNTSASSSPLFQQYETSSYSTQTSHHKSTHESARHSPGHHGAHISSRSESSRAPHSIVLKTQKSQINSLGFQLNESDIVDKGCYFVKYVEPGSASALAGLKEGDKITKINGKSTVGMNYEQFCYEIVIAQQQQQKNNMIHLMVMRRSAKVNVHSSVATAASSSSNLSGPTVLPIKNSEQKNKSIISTSTSSNLVDEGYVPGSATSATSSATTNTANVSSNNLVSVVKVTAPSEVEQDVVRTHQSRPKTPPHKNTHNIVAEEPGYVAYESTVSYKPNVIYDNEEGETLRFLPGEENQLREQEQLERKQREREKLDREQEEREKLELIRLQREREEREREQEEQDRKERERERLENERHELERIEYLKLREQEQRDREREEREEREREEREHERIKRDREQQLQDKRDREEHERQLKEQEELDEELRRKELSLNNKDPLNVQSALTALTTITVIGSEPINAETYNVEVNDKPEHYQTYNVEASDKTERINYQAYNSDGVKPYHTATHRYPIIVDEIATTTTTKSVDEVERVREEEIFEQHQQPAPVEESNFEETEYQTTSQYLPEDLDVHQRHEDQADITQRDEEDRLQQQYAEDKFNRQQEVMKHLVVAIENPEMSNELRTYELYKSQHFFGYGIAFHTEDISISKPEHKLVYPLIEIEKNSPADDAGMKDYQRVVGVNGQFVNSDFRTLEDVVQAIEDSYYSRDYTQITVIDARLWDAFMNDPELAAKLADYQELKSPSESKIYADRVIDSIISKEIPTNVKPDVSQVVKVEEEDTVLPRLCRLTRDTRSDQYGFDFKTLKNEGKHIANNVREGLPANLAGLKEGDFILEVNGESIDGVEHDSVVKKISAHATMVDLLAVNDLNSYMNYREYMKRSEEADLEAKLPSSNVVNDLTKEDVTHHKLKLVPGFKGLGISLNNNAIISSVDSESPADIAGLRKDMKIVEVNGKNVQDKSYKDIAKAIKENEKNLTIGVIDMAAQKEIVEVQNERYSEQPGVIEVTGNQSLSSKTGEKISDVRVCNLVNRPDYDGFGFSMRSNDKGPHQISNVEAESPAHYSGLKADDFVLKVNDQNVVGERYNKTVTLIKNESDKGRLKLEVVEPQLATYEMKNVLLTPAQGTLPSTKGTIGKKGKNQNIDNLRGIASDIIANGSGSVRIDNDHQRTVSIDVADSRKRPLSMNDLDRVPNSTVRSNMSYGSTTTAFSVDHPSNLHSSSSKSVNNLQTSLDKPKFKRCNVQLLPGFKGYGFTLNSKVKPKYSIYTIDQSSPAYKANLRETDVIVQIDKKNIRRQKFDKVKQLLSDSQKKGQVEILAIDREGYMYYKNRKKRFSSNKLVTMDNTEPFYTLGANSLAETDYKELNVSSEQGERTIGDMLLGSALTDNVEPVNSSPMGITSASSSLVQATLPNETTGTELDNYELLKFTILRDANKPLGLGMAQTNKTSRSLSRSSTKSGKSSKSKKSKKGESSALPIITSIDAGSPAEQSGLKPNDLILEINGKPCNGQSNKKVGEWIRSSGNSIDFLVSRERSKHEPNMVEEEIIITDSQLRDSPVANQTVETYERDAEVSSLRKSRKDSAQLSKRSNESSSQPSSPNIMHSEIRMSSSRLHQEGLDDERVTVIHDKSPISYRSNRNQSEPAPVQQQTVERSSYTDINSMPATVTPLSRRSFSSSTLPRDAPVPRLCRVRAYEEHLGFTVIGSRKDKSVFKVNEVTSNSPAAHSGLLNDDFIIEISGQPVDSMSYKDVVALIKEKKTEDDLQLLVVDERTLNWYKTKELKISSQIIPKMQYIETLLKDELQKESVINSDNNQINVIS